MPVALLGAVLANVLVPPIDSSARPEVQAANQAGYQGCVRPPASRLVVNVRDKGATPNDETDDTAAIQAAIDTVAGFGGTVFVPDGTYLVDAVGKRGLQLKSRMTFSLAPGATLKAMPNSAKVYAVLSISGASNVTVVGGTLEGDRHEHDGSTGEWGMGVRIDKGAERITISGVTSKHMWGDGFYIHDAKGVLLCSVTADHNRRQGLSVIEADGLVVTGSVFKNTGGTRPGSGIDLEPDLAAEEIINVRIQDSQFLDNAGPGLLIDRGKGPISNVAITNNAFAGNPRSIKLKHAPGVSAHCGNKIVSQDNAWTDFSALVETVTYAVTPSACAE